MSDHDRPSVQRHCDVAVIGGSAAGLAAALQLGRQRRSAIVIDAGELRNAPAAHLHGSSVTRRPPRRCWSVSVERKSAATAVRSSPGARSA